MKLLEEIVYNANNGTESVFRSDNQNFYSYQYYVYSNDNKTELSVFSSQINFGTQLYENWVIKNKDNLNDQLTFTGVAALQNDNIAQPGFVNYVVKSNLGSRWKGATLVQIEYRRSLNRVVRIYA